MPLGAVGATLRDGEGWPELKAWEQNAEMEEGESLVLDFKIKGLLTRKQVRNTSAKLLLVFEVSQQPSLLLTLLWIQAEPVIQREKQERGLVAVYYRRGGHPLCFAVI